VSLNTRLSSITMNRKIPVIVGAVVTFLVIIDLLMTRQILPYNNDSELLMFILTIIIGYGIGSWVLLGYTKRVSKEIREVQFYKFYTLDCNDNSVFLICNTTICTFQ
jgi:hypothetical protein